MGKDKDRVELRPLDEKTEDAPRLYRLHKDNVEQLEARPAPRVGEKVVPDARLEAPTRGQMKTRSNEPGLASLIEGKKEVAEDEWEEVATGRKIPWGWIALVAFAFAAGILWSLVEVDRSKDRRIQLYSEAKGVLDREKEEELEAEDTVASIERVVGNFFDSRSVEEMLTYVRHPERVRPLMERYYSDRQLKPVRVKGIRRMHPLTIEQRASFWGVGCELEGLPESQLLVEVESPAVAKVDWETYVCYQPIDWDEFVRTTPENFAGDFRVRVEEVNYFTQEFSDSERFDSFRLTALGAEEVLYGFVDKNTELSKTLREMLEANDMKPVPVLLRLEIPEEMKARRSAVIKRLVSPRWIIVDPPEVEQ